MSEKLPVMGARSFEDLKQTNNHGAEYWSARELQPLLGYTQWRRFMEAIARATESCQASGNKPDYHFAGAGNMIEIGKGAQREVDDFHLSRFACYLIAQNGDPRKPEIANAQKYFAIQTRRQEFTEQLAADMERLELRKQTGEEFKALSGAARQAGVQDRMFGVFHDAGYKGLYGGLGNYAIKSKKGIPEKEALMLPACLAAIQSRTESLRKRNESCPSSSQRALRSTRSMSLCASWARPSPVSRRGRSAGPIAGQQGGGGDSVPSRGELRLSRSRTHPLGSRDQALRRRYHSG
jgi:DNA-damage-inducible protein D